jgi:5'-methylthioadenosine phosphorylase/purine-nucleoside phosphorylase
MPIHLRAEPGDYAPAVLIPGDPRRAEYVARTFFTGAKRVNEERGMLGFTGTFEGKPISVQATGMGCPSAAIVVEELAQLGVQRVVRIGTCGGIAEGLALGDVIVAISATPADSTATHLVGGEPHAPTADFELVHAAVHVARHAGQPVRVGPVVSSDVFYDHDPERPARWRARGMLGVEMEAAVVFTLGALRGLSAGCLLVVSDLIIGEFVRIPDEELRAAVDRMTELAIRAALSEPKG